MKQKMQAFILAAGVSSRLTREGLCRTIPKPMVKIEGKPILQYNIEFLVANGITELFINLHYHPEVIVDYFGDGSWLGASIAYSYEPELLGTAGALNPVKYNLRNPFVVVYGDNLLECDLARMLHFHNSHTGIVTIAGYDEYDIKNSGVLTFNEAGLVTSFVEKPIDSKYAALVIANAGLYVVSPQVFNLFSFASQTDFAKDLFSVLQPQGQLYCYYESKTRCRTIDTVSKINRIKEEKEVTITEREEGEES